MQAIINGCVYAVDLHGTEDYEFKGLHPALIVRMLKEQNMYYVVPLTTYTKERWEKCKRKGFGVRILSTDSIARVDKMNIVSIKQIQGRYYNNGDLVVPTKDEIDKVFNRVEEYIQLSDAKSQKEYSKFAEQRDAFRKDMEEVLIWMDFNKFENVTFTTTELEFTYPCSKMSFISNSDIKDIIGKMLTFSKMNILKNGKDMRIIIEIEDKKLLTFIEKYDNFKAQKGDV